MKILAELDSRTMGELLDNSDLVSVKMTKNCKELPEYGMRNKELG